MTAPNLTRVRAEFAASNGTLYAVDKSTGAIRPMNMAMYVIASASDLLEGYHIEITESRAKYRAMQVRGQIATRN